MFGPTVSVSIHPGGSKTGFLRPANVDLRMIADMQSFFHADTGPTDCFEKDRLRRFGRTDIDSRNDIMKEMPNANRSEICIAVGHGNQRKMLRQDLKSGN